MNKNEIRVAVVGGGHGCHELLTRMLDDPERLGLRVVGVADPDPGSPCRQMAMEDKLELVVSDWREFVNRDDIDLVIELTGRPEVRDEVARSLPPHIRFIDHVTSRFFWDIFALADEGDRLRREQEQALVAERNKLRTILDSLPYELLVITKDFEVEHANRTFLDAQNLTLKQVVGKYCYDLEHKTKPACGVGVDECPHAETLQAGQSIATVVSRRDEKGLERFVSVRTAPIRDKRGNVSGVVEAIRDITQRVQTEQQLKDTRARLNQFIDVAPLFIYMKDVNLRFRVINRHALETLGLTEAQVLGQTTHDVLPESAAREFQAGEREARRTGHSVHIEGILPMPDREMHYRATLFPVKRDDDFIGLFGLIEDTTELFRSEQQLIQKSEQLSETSDLLEGVLEHSADMIFLTDPKGKMLTCNRGAERIMGRDRETVVGRRAADFFVDGDEFTQLLEHALAEGSATGYEVLFRRRSGEMAVGNISLTAIMGPDGRPAEVVGICRDITPRVKLKENLVRSDRLAAIGKMAAGVAHEINNPLAVVETIAGVLEDTISEECNALSTPNKDLLAKALERLRYQVNRAKTITHSLLGFVRRPQAGRQEVSVEELLEESLNLVTPEISMIGCEVRRDYETGLPAILTDPTLLEQVFVNLIKNAVDAIEEKGNGGGHLDLGIHRAEDGISVTVEDDGVGIPKDSLGRIFDLFHTTKPAGKGTGLGLALVHDIAARLGCEVDVTSELGKWTRFTVAIPLAAPVNGENVEPLGG